MSKTFDRLKIGQINNLMFYFILLVQFDFLFFRNIILFIYI